MQESIKRVQRNGMRYYQVSKGGEILGEFPSITTVLGGTSDKSGLEKWKKRIGEAEAKRISELSMNRGTVMHRLIELYKPLEGDKASRLEQLRELAAKDKEINQYSDEENGEIWLAAGWEMFMKFYMNSSQYFDRVKRVIEAETFLWSVKGGGYAGTVDNVSELVDGTYAVIDFKTARKPKKEEWIEDYKLQVAAYSVAVWDRYKIKISQAQIWISNEQTMDPQYFEMNTEDLKLYYNKFLERLDKFYEMFPVN